MYNKMLLAMATALVMEATSLEAAVPTSMSYQGRLVNNGTVVNGNVTMRFALYDAATDGTKVWPAAAYEEKTVAVSNGLYTAYIGATAGMELSPELFGQDLWLQVWVDGTALTRTKMTTTPYSYFSGMANGVVDNAITNAKIVNDAVTTGKIMNGAIINEDINDNAAIAGTKINPNFGTQGIATTGTLTAAATTLTGTLTGTTATFSGVVTAESNVVVGTDLAPGVIEIKDGNGKSVGITVPQITGDSYIVSLPPAAPTAAAQVLVADEDGTTSWASIPAAPVTSVAGKTGVVTLVKADVDLANVDNTSDLNKPVSTATQAALDLKAPINNPTFTGTVAGITAAMVGLGNVDNTSDLNKPVSTATQTALDLKANTADMTTALAAKETIANKKTVIDGTTADAENVNYPSVAAVKSYVDGKVIDADKVDMNTTGAYSKWNGTKLVDGAISEGADDKLNVTDRHLIVSGTVDAGANLPRVEAPYLSTPNYINSANSQTNGGIRMGEDLTGKGGWLMINDQEKRVVLIGETATDGKYGVQINDRDNGNAPRAGVGYNATAGVWSAGVQGTGTSAGAITSGGANAQLVVMNGVTPKFTADQTGTVTATTFVGALTGNAATATTAAALTGAQADAIAANSLKVGISPEQASAIAANTLKVGFTDALVAASPAVSANTADIVTLKAGQTTQDAAIALKADAANPVFTGTMTAPEVRTSAGTTSSMVIGEALGTAYVNVWDANKAVLEIGRANKTAGNEYGMLINEKTGGTPRAGIGHDGASWGVGVGNFAEGTGVKLNYAGETADEKRIEVKNANTAVFSVDREGDVIANSITATTFVGALDWSNVTNKPTIPAAQVSSDWTATEGVSQILNKPTLATVATSGSYADLSNKPTIPAAQVSSDWTATEGVSQILNKPTLATVATSGSYTDLSNKPTIPAAQVSSDWTATEGVSQILNKPTLATVATSGSYADLSNVPTEFAPSAHTQAWSTITTTPTTLAGYGITDAASTTALNDGLALKANLAGATFTGAVKGIAPTEDANLTTKKYVDDGLALKATVANFNTLSDQVNHATTGLDTKEAVVNKSTDVAADAASDIKYPSVKAVKTYVDGAVATLAGDVAGVMAGDFGTAHDGTNPGTDGIVKVFDKDLANETIKLDGSTGTVTATTFVGALTGNAATATSAAGISSASAVSIVTTAGDADISITPHGSGEVNISKVDIDGGTIDNAPIGATTPSTGAFTTLSANNGLTVSSGGAAITGNSTLAGNLGVTGTTSLATLTVTGLVTLPASSLSMEFVDGLSAALDAKAGTAHNHTIENISGLQTSLDAKASLAGPTFTGTVSADAFSGALTGNVVGNASSATKLATARNISLTGTVTADAVSFDGTGAVALNTVIPAGTITNAMLAGAIQQSKIANLSETLNGKADVDHSHSWNTITAKPTTLPGFGITDAMSTSHPANSIEANDISAWNAKQAAISAGNGIDITTNTISAKLDGETLLSDASGLKLNLANANEWTEPQGFTKGINIASAAGGYAIFAENPTTNQPGAVIWNSNAGNSSAALIAVTDGTGPALEIQAGYVKYAYGAGAATTVPSNLSVYHYTGADVAITLPAVTAADNGRVLYFSTENAIGVDNIEGDAMLAGEVRTFVVIGDTWHAVN